MPYTIARPKELPEGPVWYVLNRGRNRMLLDDPFRVLIQPMSYAQSSAIQGRLSIAGQTMIDAVYKAHIRENVLEVAGVAIEDINTGEIMQPRNATELLDALDQFDGAEGAAIIMEIGAAILSTLVLAEGDLGNLRRQRQLVSESGQSLGNGPAPAAGASKTESTSPSATAGDDAVAAIRPPPSGR